MSSKWKWSQCMVLTSLDALEEAWTGWPGKNVWEAPKTLRFLLLHPLSTDNRNCSHDHPSPWKMPCQRGPGRAAPPWPAAMHRTPPSSIMYQVSPPDTRTRMGNSGILGTPWKEVCPAGRGRGLPESRRGERLWTDEVPAAVVELSVRNKIVVSVYQCWPYFPEESLLICSDPKYLPGCSCCGTNQGFGSSDLMN